MPKSNYFKLKLRHQFRKTQHDVNKAGQSTAQHVDRHILRRWQNLQEIRRFISGWLFLAIILAVGVILQSRQLSAYYQENVPAPGGVYVEGMAGEAKNFNPIFATDLVDTSVSRLIFSSILKYDENNKLVGDLASNWEVNEDSTQYTIKLKEAFWNDGAKITSGDVVYTFELAQHPDTRSPLNSSWRDIEIQAIDEQTVVFKLPNPFTPFPHSLTTGILPKHILSNSDNKDLRSHEFNLSPKVSSGPFQFTQIVQDQNVKQVELAKNDKYHGSEPMLDQFIVRIFNDNDALLKAFQNNEITAAADIKNVEAPMFDHKNEGKYMAMQLYSGVYAFLHNQDELLQDKNLRAALNVATNKNELFQSLDKKLALIDGPLLSDHLGYQRADSVHKYDVEEAKRILNENGWLENSNGVRQKDGKKLKLSLVAQNSDEYPIAAQELQKQWQALGAEVEISLVEPNELQQNHVSSHNYQVLLLGVTLGVDPDVFAYWHSSQASLRGFNLSEYKSPIADRALEAGRTRNNPEIRAAKYKTFQEQWRSDIPAIPLYQPVFGYALQTTATGPAGEDLATPEHRYSNISFWSVNEQTIRKKL